MIPPSRAGEDSMIERKMIRVQDHDQDQLDTKPPPMCNRKSGTKQCPTPDYSPNTGYDEVSPIVTLAKRLCTFALCSSDVLLSTGSTIFRPDQETARRHPASHASPPCRENWPSEAC
jgi:hypothetical protein